MDFSLVSAAFDTLQITPPPKLILLEAMTLSAAHVPPYPPDMAVLFTNIDSPAIASQLKTILLTTYPGEHAVSVVESGEKKEQKLEEFTLADASENACLYV